jgi:hypothetical protein
MDPLPATPAQVPADPGRDLVRRAGDDFAAFNDYVDDETAVTGFREVAQCLAGCNPCRVVVDNIRKTIRLY